MTKRKVWYVHSGMESPERFDLLIELSGLRSEKQIQTIKDYLVKGVPIDAAMVMNDVTNKSNLERDLDKINDVAIIVEKIKELDWVRFRKTGEE